MGATGVGSTTVWADSVAAVGVPVLDSIEVEAVGVAGTVSLVSGTADDSSVSVKGRTEERIPAPPEETAGPPEETGGTGTTTGEEEEEEEGVGAGSPIGVVSVMRVLVSETLSVEEATTTGGGEETTSEEVPSPTVTVEPTEISEDATTTVVVAASVEVSEEDAATAEDGSKAEDGVPAT